jgi:hypothetical protein
MEPTPQSETRTYSTFGGGRILIRYARTAKDPYGALGKPRIVRWTPAFEAKVACFVEELSHLLPDLSSLVLAGAWHDKWRTDKDHKPCRHCQGRAIDIDSVWWDNDCMSLVTETAYGTNRKTYLGIEAVLRRTFGTVLNWAYDSEHHDHWHCDDGTAPVLRPGDLTGKARNSRVLFIQDALQTVFGCDCGPMDGKWGPLTNSAFCGVMGNRGGGREGYPDFLKRVAEKALHWRDG